MRILLVEDNVELSRWVARALRGASFTVECAFNGSDADAMLAREDYALVILDLTLARMDGLDVLRRLRARRQEVPVLIVTARGGVEERVQGLNLGADDYLAKPFELAELEARVKALLRRGQGTRTPAITCGDLSFDTVSRTFTCRGAALNLTPREHAVLEGLIRRAGKAISKETLFEQVFTLGDESNPDAIEVYVHRLRKKIEGTGAVITTLRGLGYLLEAPREPRG